MTPLRVAVFRDARDPPLVDVLPISCGYCRSTSRSIWKSGFSNAENLRTSPRMRAVFDHWARVCRSLLAVSAASDERRPFFREARD
jgi:hypothetical protein